MQIPALQAADARIKELEEALATTETLYRQSRAKCEQLQGSKTAAQGIEKDTADYLAMFELTRKDDRALVLLTDLLAEYRREKERADRAEGINREWQEKWLNEGFPLSKKGITMVATGE